jgi:hypothetical protein
MALGVFVAPAAMSQTGTATASAVQSPKDQAQQLQRQIDALQVPKAATQATPAPASSEGPGFQAGPVTVTFGGFTELATIFRNRNEVADVGSNWNGSNPFPNTANAHTSEFRESARQSRLTILAQGPQDGNAVAEGYFEMDFVGAARPPRTRMRATATTRGCARSTGRMPGRAPAFNARRPGMKLRDAFQSGLRGHSEQVPMTIDGSFVPGFDWTWNPQLRFIKEFSNKFSAGISFESPQANIFNDPSALPPNTRRLQRPSTAFSAGLSLDTLRERVPAVFAPSLTRACQPSTRLSQRSGC